MLTGGDDGYGTSPAPRQKKKQANDVNDNAVDAENHQASSRPADSALQCIYTMCLHLDCVALSVLWNWSDQTRCADGLHLQCRYGTIAGCNLCMSHRCELLLLTTAAHGNAMSSMLQGTVNSFKTAKAIMLEDMRKKGQTYRPQAGPSSQEADRHPSAAQAPFKRLGPAKPSQKRAGEFCWHQLAMCWLHLVLDDLLLYSCLIFVSRLSGVQYRLGSVACNTQKKC